MPVFEYHDSRLTPLERTSFEQQGILERKHLQAALRDQIEVICPDCLVIAEEFSDWADSGRRIDLLAVDKEANLVVVELKRTETGEHMDLQAIRYAAMVSTLTFKKAVEILGKYLQQRGLGGDPEEKLRQFLEWGDSQDEVFPSGVRITLASADFSKELTTAVMWLNVQGIDIRCVRLVPYKHGQQTLVDVQHIIPLPEAEDYWVGIRQQSDERKAVRQSQRDYTRYQFNGTTYNKNRLVLAVLEQHVEKTPDIAFSQLEDAFPKKLQGHYGCFETVAQAEAIYSRGRKRHFLEPEELIELMDERIAICTQWGVGNLENFIAQARSLGYEIEEAS